METARGLGRKERRARGPGRHTRVRAYAHGPGLPGTGHGCRGNPGLGEQQALRIREDVQYWTKKCGFAGEETPARSFRLGQEKRGAQE